MPPESLTARVVRLEAQDAVAVQHRTDRDREIRDIKLTVNAMDAKLDLLIADKNSRDTLVGLGKWLVASGLFGTVGALAMWIWQAFDQAPVN
jgi:hypothetical protein